jgi:hypothetical protein
VSSDGRFVAFQSEASDLVAAEDFNLLWDVFVFDVTTGAITRVSGDPGEVWMEPSGGPSIDGRGTVVAFSSRHPTDASDKKNDFDLYVATVSNLNTEARRLLQKIRRSEEHAMVLNGSNRNTAHYFCVQLFLCPSHSVENGNRN